MDIDALEQELEAEIERIGFEFVDLERSGSKTRPVLRIRIDKPGSEPGRGVTIEDCTAVSRALETYLEDRTSVGERYVLEVSSPGIERPLVKRRDFERFSGKEIAVKTKTSIGEHGKRVEGVLLGIQDAGGREQVRLELPTQEIVEISRDDIVRANLVFRWEDDK